MRKERRLGTTEIIAPPGVPQIFITRDFAAPRELVFRAYTDAELLVQWLGPRAVTTTIDHFDVRHGGTWRYIGRDGDGNEFVFRGVFHGDPSPENGIVQTFEYEATPGHVCLETATFEEQNGRTVVRQNSVYQSVEDRDAMIGAGMEVGVTEGFERLDELLARLAPVR
jgi:uncharacterized protein YndB with AHSA1/START domain